MVEGGEGKKMLMGDYQNYNIIVNFFAYFLSSLSLSLFMSREGWGGKEEEKMLQNEYREPGV